MLAGLDNFNDLFREVFANSRVLSEIGVCFHLSGKGVGRRLNRPSRIAVRSQPKRVGSLDFEQVGQFFEDSGNLCVGHGATRYLPASAGAAAVGGSGVAATMGSGLNNMTMAAPAAARTSPA